VKEAGCVILGKTTMPDFGMLASGVSSLHGTTRNPWDIRRNTAGSSSGAGAAVAAGDAVVLPGIAGGMTATVSHVERAPSESFVTLYMRLPANIFTLRYVEVWKQNTP